MLKKWQDNKSDKEKKELVTILGAQWTNSFDYFELYDSVAWYWF